MLLSLMKKELLALSRDIHGLGALFFMPVVFIIVMSMALKDVYSPETKVIAYAIVQQDSGKAAQRLVELWTKEHNGEVAAPENWQDQVRAGKLKYVLQIEPGFSKTANTPDDSAKPRLHLLADPGLDNGIFEANRARLAALAAQLRIESLLAQLPGPVAKQGAGALDGNALVSAERLAASTRPTAVQQNVPAWLVFGMFFVVTSIAGLFVDERGSGVLARLRSLGVSPLRMIAAKILPYVLVNGVQAALMLAVGVWFMPLIGGDALSLTGIHWGALLAMLLSVSVAAVSMALAIASLVRTHAQASAFGPILNVLMAALGGVMVPIFVMPAAMQQIARYSPMNWGLEGLLDVVLRGGNIAAILPEAGRLWLFALLMLAAAYGLFRRRA
jgi:ABC-2 type transport system permease protein